jgi:hypothetical protein
MRTVSKNIFFNSCEGCVEDNEDKDRNHQIFYKMPFDKLVLGFQGQTVIT